jgi:ssRNA-specific RNase YbeY (16S rRNA maturation enzyme)
MNLRSFPVTLESKLHLLTEHILLDQNQVEMQVNLKLISSNEMIKLNGNFRDKELDTNVLSFPVG